MASPRLLPSSTSANSDLTRQSCTYSVTNRDPHNDRSSNKFGNTMSMDELITDIYGDDPPPPPPPDRDFDDRKMSSNEITLEEFLFRMGVVGVIEEDVKVPEMLGVGHRLPPQPGEGSSSDSSFWMGNGGGGRGKRRAVYTDPGDKVAQQRQRRMIKNRESAARSRERKQAYTMELESLVTQLEDENSLLQRERALLNWERYKQLMKNLIPVEEKRKPRSGHVLRRAHSAHW